MGEIKTRNWIKDGTDDTPAYIIRIARGNTLVGFLAGDLSTVLDLLGDQAYAEAIGEKADDVTVWVLTEYGPLLCSIASKSHPGAGFIEHRVMWRDPMKRGRVPAGDHPGETGYTKIVDF